MVKAIRNKSLAQRCMTALQLGLVCLITFFAVKTIIVFLTPQSAWTSPEFSAAPVGARPAAAQASYDFSFDPFHRDQLDTVVANIGGDAPETTLNLKLFGRRAGEDGSAILRTPDGKQGVYEIGDEIISNVVLKAVTPDYIVLSQSGRLERLTFDRDKGGTLMAPTPERNAATPQGNTSLPSGDLLSAVSLKAVKENGRTKGYTIVSRNPAVNLRAYGIEDGDVITKIGSQDLTKGTPNAASLMAQLGRPGNTKITLIRGGRTMTVKVGRP